MRGALSILLYMLKLATWLPFIFLILLAIKISAMFGEAGWAAIKMAWTTAKTMVEWFT